VKEGYKHCDQSEINKAVEGQGVIKETLTNSTMIKCFRKWMIYSTATQ